MKVHTICTKHGQTAVVGPGTLLDELECTTCIATTDGTLPPPIPTDPEELFISRITRHHNGNCCCGTCEPDFCHNCGHYAQFCTCWRGVTIYSPNFCDHLDTGDELADRLRCETHRLFRNEHRYPVGCAHPACNAAVPF